VNGVGGNQSWGKGKTKKGDLAGKQQDSWFGHKRPNVDLEKYLRGEEAKISPYSASAKLVFRRKNWDK